jgi:uncharacterized protein (UPF0218 family)
LAAQILKKIINLKLPNDKRAELKKPLGSLIKGKPSETIRHLKKILEIQNPLMFASVGDFVSANILEHCINPDIIVIDHRIMRQDVEPMKLCREKIKVKNIAGTISVESQKALADAVMLNKKLGIIVEGEEDLLVLPLMNLMPMGSIIVYGQPKEGIVIVTLTEERKRWAKNFMKQMEGK